MSVIINKFVVLFQSEFDDCKASIPICGPRQIRSTVGIFNHNMTWTELTRLELRIAKIHLNLKDSGSILKNEASHLSYKFLIHKHLSFVSSEPHLFRF